MKPVIVFFLLLSIQALAEKGGLKVCFTGDVMLDRAVEQKIKNQGFNFISDPIDSLLSSYPFRVINLECPLTNEKNPFEKPYSFSVDTSLVRILKLSGVTHAAIANNHINDQHSSGADETYSVLFKNGIAPIGYRPDNLKKCNPVEIEQSGVTLALFAAMQLDVTEDEDRNICNCKELTFLQEIKQYKSAHPSTIVVCYLHWGTEYLRTPSTRQKELAKKMIDNGADIIIGHHPHVVQTIEYYNHKPIFYSLGNLVFDQQQPDTKQGLVLGVSVNDESMSLEIIPYRINDFHPIQLNRSEMDYIEAKTLQQSKNIVFKKSDKGWIVEEKDSTISTNSIELVSNFSSSTFNVCDANFCGSVSLKKLTHLVGYRLTIDDTLKHQRDELHLKYPVYRFEYADVDGDGNTDILAGVIKSTHFEPELDRRLFIFRIDSNQIRPLWLGSKLCQGLIDFRCVIDQKKCIIISLEKTKKELYCIGIYRWQNFGLQLIAYKYSDLDYKTALTRFEDEK